MKKPILIILTFSALCFTSCKKGSDKPSGSSSDSYFPVTSGSSWTYKDVVNGTSGTENIKMTGATSVINGKTFYTITNTTNLSNKGSSTGYIYSANHSYAMRASNGGLIVEVQLGDDSKAVGDSWTTIPTDAGTINGLAARTVNTIKEKDITKVVNGKTFTDVIHTQVDVQYDMGGFTSVMVYDIYLAKGVGMIEMDTQSGGSPYEIQTITDYTVK